MRIGIAGAYGATGSLVVERLAATTSHDLLVGGRNADRAAALAAELGDRASAQVVDVMRPGSLAEFCDACDLLVNCAGPSHLVRDRVARVAVERRTDLVDVGGAELTFPELTRNWDEPAQAGVTVIVDAGWIPGLSGVLAHAVAARARETMELERLEMVYGDGSDWSDAATLDIVELVRMRPGLGTMRGGRFVPADGARGTVRRVRLPEPFGGRIATLAFASELHQLGERLDGELACWAVPLAGPRATAALLASLAVLRGRPWGAARLVASATRADARPPGGVVAVRATGTRDAQPVRLTGLATTSRSHALTATVCAATARAAGAGELSRPGCHYLCDVADPASLLAALPPDEVRLAIDAAPDPLG